MHCKNALKRHWAVAAVAPLLLLMAPQAMAQNASGASEPSFTIHSAAGVQAERSVTVTLETENSEKFEVYLPELLIQMAREANRGTIALIPALDYVVVLPMPEFALLNRGKLPLLSEVDQPDHRLFELLPAGSTDRNYQRVHGVSVKKVPPGTTAEQDARDSLASLRSACLAKMSGYQFEIRKESGRGILLSACSNFNTMTARTLDPSIRGSFDISMSYVIGDTAFRFYSIHRSGSWNPDTSAPPLSEAQVRAVVALLDKAVIFEGIDEMTLTAAFLMAEN